MKTRLFGIVLSFVLAFTLMLPASVFADGGEASGQNPTATKKAVSSDAEKGNRELSDKLIESIDSDVVKAQEIAGESEALSETYMSDVTGVYVYPFTSSSVELYWDKIYDENLLGYEIYYSLDSEFSDPVRIVVDDSSDFGYYVVPGLTAGKKYYFAVVAYGYDDYNKTIYSEYYYPVSAVPSANVASLALSSSKRFKATQAQLYYSGSYLVCKVKFTNKTKRKIKYIYKSRIAITDVWGQTYVNYKFSKKKINLKKKRSKWVYFKIPSKYTRYYANLRYDLNRFSITYSYK